MNHFIKYTFITILTSIITFFGFYWIGEYSASNCNNYKIHFVLGAILVIAPAYDWWHNKLKELFNL
jgi:lipopolysaccharide export LptBFGC system permease protein LptF